ncbi:uncharacterized protein KY384_000787 [Bacidia gigantensis]|uniref:uncharacterized protein n=1 Tax=Bacidia gigantensis TaxID=2732470 RepID=UPI001D03F848|nr:uncharacterized protein KY384_000787 [Bacidia gigantensis]KAG8526025.1 hypothetical protein KY384_000787 [Bacidia gigantensis]
MDTLPSELQIQETARPMIDGCLEIGHYAQLAPWKAPYVKMKKHMGPYLLGRYVNRFMKSSGQERHFILRSTGPKEPYRLPVGLRFKIQDLTIFNIAHTSMCNGICTVYDSLGEKMEGENASFVFPYFDTESGLQGPGTFAQGYNIAEGLARGEVAALFLFLKALFPTMLKVQYLADSQEMEMVLLSYAESAFEQTKMDTPDELLECGLEKPGSLLEQCWKIRSVVNDTADARRDANGAQHSTGDHRRAFRLNQTLRMK